MNGGSTQPHSCALTKNFCFATERITKRCGTRTSLVKLQRFLHPKLSSCERLKTRNTLISSRSRGGYSLPPTRLIRISQISPQCLVSFRKYSTATRKRESSALNTTPKSITG